MTLPALRKATPADTPGLAAMLARAFADDPWVTWMVRADARRDQARERFFALSCRKLALPWDESWTTAELTGAALWVPPGRWHLRLLEHLPSLLSFASVTGALRLPTVWRGSAPIGRLHPHAPHWYLLHLAVEPAAQGRGLGQALLRPILERCDREGSAAYLETARERNLGFYGKSGFTVTAEHQIPRGPRVWMMWRDPQGRSA